MPYILFKSFEKRVLEKSVFQDYLKKKQITGSSEYEKIYHRKCQGILKIMSNEDD